MNEPIMPVADSAERAFLGSMLIDPLGARRFVNMVKEDWFTRNDYRIAWDAIQSIVAAGQVPDYDVLSGYMERYNRDPDGDIMLAVGLAMGSNTSNSAYVDSYVDQMRKAWQQRRLMEDANVLAAAGYKGDLETALKTVGRLLKDLTGAGRVVPEMDGMQALQSMFDGVELYMSDPDSALKTGIAALDHAIGPMFPGMVITVGAASSVGKSTLLLSLALRMAARFEHLVKRAVERNEPPVRQTVEYLTFEMTASQQMMRAAANLHPNVTIEDLVYGFWNEEEKETDWARYYTVRAELEERMETLGKHLYFHQVARSTDEIRAMVRSAVLERGSRIFFIDQSEYVASDERDMVKRYTEIYQAYKNIAIEFNVVIVPGHQLSRKVTERTTKIPELEDLRESGGVGNASDVVVLMYRPSYYWLWEGTTDGTGPLPDPDWYREGLMLFIAKRRMGAARRSSARAYVRFDEKRCMIDNRPDHWHEQDFIDYYSIKNGTVKEA